MPIVFLPPALRSLADGEAEIQVEGTSVRQVLAALRERFPELAATIITDEGLRPGLALAIDGHVSNRGLLASVNPTSEIHFLPVVGGG